MKKYSRLEGLLRDNLQTDLEAEDEVGSTFSDISEPWMGEFNQYLKTVEAVAEDVDIVSWWGVRGLKILPLMHVLTIFYGT